MSDTRQVHLQFCFFLFEQRLIVDFSIFFTGFALMQIRKGLLDRLEEAKMALQKLSSKRSANGK
jgi:hypothetical protein